MNRCPGCRTRRATFAAMLEHIKRTGHKLCDCGGGGHYHYAHRPGSRYCTQNPMSDVWIAADSGATKEELLEIEVEIALSKPGRPFKNWRD